MQNTILLKHGGSGGNWHSLLEIKSRSRQASPDCAYFIVSISALRPFSWHWLINWTWSNDAEGRSIHLSNTPVSSLQPTILNSNSCFDVTLLSHLWTALTCVPVIVMETPWTTLSNWTHNQNNSWRVFRGVGIRLMTVSFVDLNEIKPSSYYLSCFLLFLLLETVSVELMSPFTCLVSFISSAAWQCPIGFKNANHNKPFSYSLTTTNSSSSSIQLEVNVCKNDTF